MTFASLRSVVLEDTPTCTHTHMKGTLTEPLIRPVSPEFSEEATSKKDGGSVHAHQATQFGHHGLPAKDYEVHTMTCIMSQWTWMHVDL